MKVQEDLVQHLCSVTGLEPAVTAKILEEIHHWYTEGVPAWVQRRHRELRRQGLRNREIYPQLRREAEAVLVRPGPLSERQIRRMIYG